MTEPLTKAELAIRYLLKHGPSTAKAIGYAVEIAPKNVMSVLQNAIDFDVVHITHTTSLGNPNTPIRVFRATEDAALWKPKRAASVTAKRPAAPAEPRPTAPAVPASPLALGMAAQLGINTAPEVPPAAAKPAAKPVATPVLIPPKPKAPKAKPARDDSDLLDRIATMSAAEFGDFIGFLSRTWAWKRGAA